MKLKIVILAGLLLTIASCKLEPKRQMVFFNSSNEELNIVMVKDSVFVFDKVLKPHTTIFGSVELGTYNINTYKTNGDLVRKVKNYTLTKEKENEYNSYICVDLTAQYDYLLVKTHYLYEATNSLAQSLADASGLNTENVIESHIKSNQPFVFLYRPVFPFEPLPKSIDALNAGWALVPITKNLSTKDSIYMAVDTYFNEIGFEQ